MAAVSACETCKFVENIVKEKEHKDAKNSSFPIEIAIEYITEYQKQFRQMGILKEIQFLPNKEKFLTNFFQNLQKEFFNKKKAHRIENLEFEKTYHTFNYCVTRLEKMAQWTKNIEISNFQKINDFLYRGGKLTEESLCKLSRFNIKTIICIDHEQDDTKIKGSKGFICKKIPFKPDASSEEITKHILSFLKYATNEKLYPIYFHCRWGVDRTGLMAAAFRVAIDNWTVDEALKEMDQFTSQNPAYFLHYKKHLLFHSDSFKKRGSLGS